MRFVQVLFALVLVALCGASPAKYYRSIPKSHTIGKSHNPRYARQDSETSEIVDQLPEQEPEAIAEIPQEPDSLNETEPQEDLPQEDLPQDDQGNSVDEQVSGTTESAVVADEPASEPAAEPSSDSAAEVPAEAPSDEAAPVAEDAAPEALAPPEPVPVPAPSPALIAPAPAPVAPAPAPVVPAPAPSPSAPAPTPVSGAPARKNKTTKGRKPAAPAANDDSPLASWPFGAPGRGASSFNTFFPIFLGGNSPSGRSRTRSANGESGSLPGSATAIANAFSTGKGSAATSHATSFGNPLAAAAFRNAGLFQI